MALPRMSAVTAIALLLVALFAWGVAEVAKQVIAREVGWWAPRLEALLASVAALIAPPKHRKKGLRRQWRAELDFDRAPGETRVLMAAAFVVASIHMWRRPPQDDDATVAEIIRAADGATVTDSAVATVALAAVVVQVTAAVHADGELTANASHLVGGTGGGAGVRRRTAPSTPAVRRASAASAGWAPTDGSTAQRTPPTRRKSPSAKSGTGH